MINPHLQNFAGTYGLESERHPGYFYCGYNKFDPVSVCARVLYLTALIVAVGSQVEVDGTAANCCKENLSYIMGSG